MRRKKEKKKSKLKILYFIIPLILIIGAGVGAYYYVNGKIYVPTKEDFFTTPKEKEAAKFDEEKGIINILLVGLDGRESREDSRTDSIILATLDTNNKRVKLTSFMRDMYLPIPGYKDNRINTAYFLGGPELLMKTINQDFDMNVQYYASIDFKAFQELVEKLGGVNMDVKDYEVKEINKYIKEVNGSKAILIENPGFQKLNGQQALSYCRIRKVGNNDFERTERQRKVLGELVNKAKKTNIIKLSDLFTTILPYVKTNIPTNKLMNIGYTVFKFGGTGIDSLRIPGDGMFEGADVYGMSVLVPDLEKNMNLLNKFVFSNGGSLASNMPAYMANNYHAEDKPVDHRGKVRSVPKIVIPKPDPVPPEGVIIDKGDTGIVPGENPGDNNTGGTGNDSNSGNTSGETPGNGGEIKPGDGTDNGGQTTPDPGAGTGSGENPDNGTGNGSETPGENNPPGGN